MPRTLPIGIYEKALPLEIEWSRRLDLAKQAGFDFVELSCDESAERQARMDWNVEQRKTLRTAVENSGVPLLTMCLSAHRRLALGSGNPAIREQGLILLRKAIDFCGGLGIRMIQIAGYYDYYGEIDEDSEKRYVDALALGLQWASNSGVMLAVETMEGEHVVDSITAGLRIVEQLDSPWFQIYPDIGNLAAHGFDVSAELQRARGHLVGVHVKDSRPGEPRRVPFGKGVVPFVDAFRTLAALDFRGPILVEMWNDNRPDSMELVAGARKWVLEKMQEGGLIDDAAL